MARQAVSPQPTPIPMATGKGSQLEMLSRPEFVLFDDATYCRGRTVAEIRSVCVNLRQHPTPRSHLLVYRLCLTHRPPPSSACLPVSVPATGPTSSSIAAAVGPSGRRPTLCRVRDGSRLAVAGTWCSRVSASARRTRPGSIGQASLSSSLRVLSRGMRSLSHSNQDSDRSLSDPSR